MVRVVVAGSHAVVCAGVRLLLDAQDDISVEDEARSAEEAVRKARLHKPDVVLLDVAVNGSSGLEAVPEIRRAAPKARLLVLSTQTSPSYVREAFASGASGYLLLDAAEEELIAAVHQVAAGQDYLYPALGAQIAIAEAAAEARAAAVPLSEREREVAELLARGYTNPEIARRLYISVRTAESHRSHIMVKLHIASRAELVRYALEHGLLAPNDAADDPLSERERQVLQLLVRGHENRGIARLLYISVRTVETHRAHLMAKLGISTRAELVHYALERGLLAEDDATA